MINSEMFLRFGLFFILETLTIWAFYKIPIYYIFDNNFKYGQLPNKPFLIEKIFSFIKWSIFSCLFGAISVFLCFNSLEVDNKISRELINKCAYISIAVALVSSVFGIFDGYRKLNKYLEN